MNKLIYNILIALVLTWLSACASMNSPQGGPRDSLPPSIKSTTPPQLTTHFTGKRIAVEFNEYVQLKDQQKLFFVSPEVDKKPQLSIKGRSIVVDFPDTLLPNQTYRLDFGSSIADNNESNRLDGYTFTFSTGDHIDSLVMAGQAIDAQTRDTIIGAFIPFYDILKDSTYAERGLDSTLFKTRAEALFRSDSSGYFIADLLQEKPYRIYAIADNNGNQRYEMGTDMVGFIDSTFNPIDMPPFMFGYDSTKRRTVIDTVQFTLEVFPETPIKRQMLSSHNRPNRSQLELLFSAYDAIIYSIDFDSMPTEWLIVDPVPTGDTVTYWISPPTVQQYEALPDTIRGRMIYAKQDSVMQLRPDTAKLTFTHIDKAKLEKEEKERKALEEKEKETEKEKNKNKKKESNEQEEVEEPVADSVAKETNPFGFKVQAATELNPENNIVLMFDYPILSIDSSKIELIQIATEQIRGARRNSSEQTKEIRSTVPIHTVVNNLRQITLTADWQSGTKYELVIPSDVLKNSIHQSNDTLKSSFTILDPDKFGTLTFKTVADTSAIDTSLYIFDLVTITYSTDKTTQTVVKSASGVKAGDVVKFRFLSPGDYYLRITRDDDGNGLWTSGDLRHRKQPESVRFLTDRGARLALKGKEGWDVEEIVNLTKVMEGKDGK